MNPLPQDQNYKHWLTALKNQFAQTQLKAAVTVNSTLLQFYWSLGEQIVEKQQQQAWGSGFLKQLSQDLCAEFPEVKGFSLSNVKYIRRWYSFYSEAAIGQQAVDQFLQYLQEYLKSSLPSIEQIERGL